MAAAALRSAGYLGKSLPEKLGFKAGMKAAFIALPAELRSLAECVPFAKLVQADSWDTKLPAKTLDAIHAFHNKPRRARCQSDQTAGGPEARRHDLGVLSEERGESSDRCHRMLFAVGHLRSISSMSR